MENKVHYKLHKVKKQWVTIAVASAALATVVGGLSATTSSVSADETQDKIVTQPKFRYNSRFSYFYRSNQRSR